MIDLNDFTKAFDTVDHAAYLCLNLLVTISHLLSLTGRGVYPYTVGDKCTKDIFGGFY